MLIFHCYWSTIQPTKYFLNPRVLSTIKPMSTCMTSGPLCALTCSMLKLPTLPTLQIH